MNDEASTPAVAAEPRTDERAAAAVILAVGASGAETDALARLLTMLPNGRDLSVVVVLRDREALDEDRLQELLAQHSRTLVTAVEGAPIQGGRLYLPPAGVLTTLEEG